MATVACYGAQLVILGMLIGFATKCFQNGANVTGGWFSAAAIITVMGWSCKYTILCQ